MPSVLVVLLPGDTPAPPEPTGAAVTSHPISTPPLGLLPSKTLTSKGSGKVWHISPSCPLPEEYSRTVCAHPSSVCPLQLSSMPFPQPSTGEPFFAGSAQFFAQGSWRPVRRL